jgi:hypothetical protein
VKLDDHVADWLFATCAWWLEAFGPLDEVTLVLPTTEHFPDPSPTEVLARMIEYAAMDGWRFEVEDDGALVLDDPMPHVPRPAFPAAALVAEEAPPALGEHGPYPIPITREEASDPTLLVATLARGISHYLVQTADEPPSDDDPQREAIVEVSAVLLGFGVFIANTAFRLRKFDDGQLHGWSASAQGQLGEDALGYAVAIFVELGACDERGALAHLQPNARAACKWALGQLRGPRAADLAALREIVPASAAAGPYR